MSEDKGQGNRSIDILGIKPLGDAALKVTEAAIAGASSFLSRICLPASEEFGLLLRDRVSHWRARNAAKIAAKAEERVAGRDSSSLRAHPRLVAEIIDKGSWNDEDDVLNMWAGLLASSCNSDTYDDSNLVFTTILSQLTTLQVRLLAYACEHAPKYASPTGLPFSDEFHVIASELMRITAIEDIHRLDRELDHLRSLELLGLYGGFNPDILEANIAPTPLAMHLYVRGQGYIGSPVEYWSLKPKAG
jgi:hypothetical protein